MDLVTVVVVSGWVVWVRGWVAAAGPIDSVLSPSSGRSSLSLSLSLFGSDE